MYMTAVSNGSKVQIWKQITTCVKRSYFVKCCFQWFKGTNLKANHNESISLFPNDAAVSNGSKVQIWKQITTGHALRQVDLELFPMVQRYKFESKSQRLWHHCPRGWRCFQWFKGTNLKANHNCWIGRKDNVWLFPMVQRYKFESKSQRKIKDNAPAIAVSNGSKVQIWKQITTCRCRKNPDGCCFQWFKGTNLKANHNRPRS